MRTHINESAFPERTKFLGAASFNEDIFSAICGGYFGENMKDLLPQKKKELAAAHHIQGLSNFHSFCEYVPSLQITEDGL